MLASQIPPKFPVPFAASAGTANIRAIPVASQITTQPGAASLTDGFPPLNMVPIPAGGIPPFGQDMNGILNEITKWNQWQSAGGPIRYDAAFAASIGGYPAGALIESNSGHALFESLVDNNAADPNSASTQWAIIACVWSAHHYLATGSANVQVVTLSPPPASLAQMIGIPLRISSQGANTGPVTLNPNGLGAIPILWSGGAKLSQGVLTTGAPFSVVYDGFNFIMQTASNVFTDATNSGVIVDGSANSSGANIELKGNGATTPNKFIRVLNGALQFVNSAYNTVIASLDNLGNFAATGGITAVDNIVTNGRLRASLGASGGDANTATLVVDFPLTVSGPGGVAGFPSGFTLQSGNISAGASLTTNLIFTNIFPTACLGVWVCEENAVGSWGAGAPTIYAASNIARNGCQVYALKWNGSAWVPSGGTSCQWQAWGY